MKILCVSTRKIETAEDIKNCFPICEIMPGITQEQKDGKIQEWLDTEGKEISTSHVLFSWQKSR